MNRSLKNCSWLSKLFLFNQVRGLIIAYLFFTYTSMGQIANYVNNGGFEAITSATTMGFVNVAEYWQPIDTNKFAYFLFSKHPQINTAPYCSTGFQQPYNGNNLVALSFYCSTCTYTNSRAYPRNRLKQMLSAGKIYCAKYYLVTTNNSPLSIDSYGMYFADSNIDTINYCGIPLSYISPQIQQNGFITDTLNWTAITGTFVATGSEKYVVLGNFKSNATTNTLLINPTYSQTLVNDVYIDDVSLIELDLPAFAGKDTSCIPGTSVYLGRQRDVGIDEACKWYKLPVIITPTTPAIAQAAGLWVSPTETSTYVVRQDICGVIKFDTAVVFKDGVGLEKLKLLKEELKIYPVPASEKCVLSVENDNLIQGFNRLVVFNSLGQIVLNKEVIFKQGLAELETGFLAGGSYTIELSNGTNERIVKKLLITEH